MPDRERVINTIDGCINDKSFCNKCDYDGCVFQHGSCEKDLLAAALSLLKEQPEIEPKQVDLYGKDDWYGLVCVCPDCKAEWMSDKDDTHFCPKCGNKVKWE